MRVLKFGGTSVADADAIERLAGIVAHASATATRGRDRGRGLGARRRDGRLLEVADARADGRRRSARAARRGALRARHLAVVADALRPATHAPRAAREESTSTSRTSRRRPARWR